LFDQIVIYNANGLAFFLSLGIIVLFIIRKKISVTYFWLLSFYFSFLIFLTGSRKDLLIIIILLLVVFESFRKISINKIIVFPIISMIILYFFLDFDYIYNLIGYRIENLIYFLITGSTQESSLNSRIGYYVIGFDLISTKPFFGYGLNSFRTLSFTNIYSHSNIIEVLVNGGILGLILAYSYRLYLLVKYIYRKSPVSRIITLVLLIYIINDFWAISYFKREYYYPLIFVILLSRYRETKRGSDINDKKTI
jgi:O-antigen ligase